jgi:GNAT superfamily N-acetyltransferase
MYEYRRINYDNLADVVYLLRVVAGKNYTVNYYQKKYDTPWSKGVCHGWLAYEKDSNKVVSVAASLPMMATLPDGTTVPMTQMIETFTLPEHRGRGLMTIMVRMILDEQIQQGTKLFFGLLNQNNVHGFVRKLGFTHTHTMQYYRLKVRTFPLEAICRKLGVPSWSHAWTRRVVAAFKARNPVAMPNSVIQEGFAGVLHDASFYRYKSFTFNQLCEFFGIQSWLKFESGLLVGDVLLPDDCSNVQFEAWMTTLLDIARRAGLRQIVFQAASDTRLSHYLSGRMRGSPSWSVCCMAADASMVPTVERLRFGYGDFETF